jgi:hypothetical protein
MRKSAKKALIAIGRKITVVIWHVLNDNKPYNPALVIVHEPTKLNAKKFVIINKK